jgi:hypothetical protein
MPKGLAVTQGDCAGCRSRPNQSQGPRVRCRNYFGSGGGATCQCHFVTRARITMFRLSRSVEVESDFDKSDLVLEIPASICPGVSGCFGSFHFVETLHRDLPSFNTS